MNRKSSDLWRLIIFIIIGIVAGSVLSELARGAQYFEWLSFGKEFGISTDSPLFVDIGLLRFKLAIMFNITVGGILGIIFAIFTYNKTR